MFQMLCLISQSFSNSFLKLKCFTIYATSLTLKPLPSCALYCTGTAARNMMFKTLAAKCHDVKVLNWSPGPIVTDTFNELLKSWHQDLAQTFIIKRNQIKSCVKCSDSAEKFLNLILTNGFTSGELTNYYVRKDFHVYLKIRNVCKSDIPITIIHKEFEYY
ncbi:unnamed protein product [Clavelina lepadiformis]|uniref:Uncharacterized protein n=1 Tax=Clavelina lepadiformis TaxID=159417 RepID=A0ABP0FT59_CLALP